MPGCLGSMNGHCLDKLQINNGVGQIQYISFLAPYILIFGVPNKFHKTQIYLFLRVWTAKQFSHTIDAYTTWTVSVGRDIQFITSSETSHPPSSQYLIFRAFIAGIDSVAEDSSVAKPR